jgi:hypothetical protein
MNYAEQALAMPNHEVMWQAIVEACKILKYPEPSHNEIILRNVLTCHVLFGIKYILSSKELFL